LLYIDLFRSLAAHNIPYLLVGGLAVNLHGIPRLTMDVDLAVKFTRESVSGLEAVCRELSLIPVQPVSIQHLADPAQRERLRHNKNMAAFSLRPPAATDPTVDVLLETVWDFDSAWERRIVRKVGEVSVNLASIQDLITMKLALRRPQDLADVEHLRRFQHEPSS
jgi:hypothetical protein